MVISTSPRGWASVIGSADDTSLMVISLPDAELGYLVRRLAADPTFQVLEGRVPEEVDEIEFRLLTERVQRTEAP